MKPVFPKDVFSHPPAHPPTEEHCLFSYSRPHFLSSERYRWHPKQILPSLDSVEWKREDRLWDVHHPSLERKEGLV